MTLMFPWNVTETLSPQHTEQGKRLPGRRLGYRTGKAQELRCNGKAGRFDRRSVTDVLRKAEMEIAVSACQCDDIDNILTVLVIFVTVAVVVVKTVTLIFRMNALTVSAFKKGNDKDLTIVVVNVDVDTYDGSQIAAAQKCTENRPYENLGFHSGGEFTKNIVIFVYSKRKLPTSYDTVDDRIRQRSCRT